MRLLFFGPPGAGKGTQAKKVAQEFQIVHISTGDILRDAVSKGTELGKMAKAIMDRGELVSDEIMNSLVKERLEELDSFILDGYPRTLDQAKFLDQATKELQKEIDAAVLIDVSEEEIVKRISNRRVCPNCGKVYNLITLQPKEDEKCDVCGTKLIQRDDDKEEVVRERYKVYKKNTEPVIEYYRKNNKIITIDGAQNVEDVTKELFNILRSFNKQ
ncbi:Nucleoside-triphosphate--adenylate kinase [Petrotoga mobilis SJ95]|uniref:Adenylate kinase n=1 Tax=Petrotoga mobilis (strain DSM 10674 / SJ95) TaxID=403833 RepID=KAD_PETMO|nr:MULTISPECIES: adenylate kinase [Petrotoga]A9BFZ7.1 RecName: Full=Adenylate kinase; Short=AK; AltName: Full=ATP-AMP transphosphorylase; AltName: Full=ATP:AMP phosphotransferase; AltName: Full=Adenylate monophosphate kinase [Petrotoga mobilis SJ95]MDK2812082.1 adenylate kinase [Petrotoga sp.]ABX31493.1 Nucleoside-triphosphate--adenylate kinase [Petrotoga mobilis SJ95]PNR89730.1 adenylate kinase [Petrotoga sp. 9T1HF07.CasAA.8.2]PNR91897.1 adenylate kinase [Petrotoga sp. HWHPT.55.6.3]RLL82136.